MTQRGEGGDDVTADDIRADRAKEGRGMMSKQSDDIRAGS